MIFAYSDSLGQSAVFVLLGLSLLWAEVFVPAFGLLGIAGIFLSLFGGFSLVDQAGYHVEPTSPLGLGIIAISLGIFFVFSYFSYKVTKMKKPRVDEELYHSEGRVVSVNNETEGQVAIQGEIWACECKEPLHVGEKVHVIHRKGLKLTVRRN